MQITENAYAKINLSLDVIAKRPDGYHDLSMVMQAIDLHDTLTLSLTTDGRIHLNCDDPMLASDQTNLAYRAARAYLDAFDLSYGCTIHLLKRIPVQAGLAGGSSDAAAVLRALNQLTGVDVALQSLIPLAKTLGADVPFCLMGGTALAEGIGECLTPIDSRLHYSIVLVKPAAGIETVKVFGRYDQTLKSERPDNRLLVEQLKAGDAKAFKQMINVLEPVSTAILPDIADIKTALYENGATRALMTGSGSTVYGLFTDPFAAKTAHSLLQGRWSSTRVYLVKPQ